MEVVNIQNLYVRQKAPLSVQGCEGLKECVSSLSFSLEEGEALAIVGKNGAGKSLTVMALMDVLPPNLSWHADKRFIAGARPSFMMQNAADCFDPLFTVRHTFWETLPSFFDKVKREHVARQLLDEVGLSHEVLSLYPFEMSGGMLHRLMLALALAPILIETYDGAQATRVLIADEPLTGLDAPARAHFLRRLGELQRKYKFALIYIDHNLASVRALAHKVLVLQEGCAVEYGEARTVFASPQHKATQSFVEAAQSHTLEHIPAPAALRQKELVLACDRVSKSYAVRRGWLCAPQKKALLFDVTLHLHRGEGLGLVGMNGAGKSTLMRILLGLEAFDGGVVSILGQDIVSLLKTSSWRTRIQPVFQHARMAVNERLTVDTIMKEPLCAHGVGVVAQQARVEELLELVGLPQECTRHYPTQLSGGQLQRLCFARALALRPDILLLDEAFTDMDVPTSLYLQEMLVNLQAKHGLAYICISHSMHTLLRLCHNIVLLDEGRIVENFAARDFSAPHRHRVFAQMVRASAQELAPSKML